jgi:hypothetical protein
MSRRAQTKPEIEWTGPEEMDESDVSTSDSESDDGSGLPLFDSLEEDQFNELHDLIVEYVDDYEKLEPGTWEAHWKEYWQLTRTSWKRQKA